MPSCKLDLSENRKTEYIKQLGRERKRNGLPLFLCCQDAQLLLVSVASVILVLDGISFRSQSGQG